MTNNEALKAIAKSLQKIAKEMKKANEPEDTYTYALTEEGKALVEEHKNECEELSDIPSNINNVAAAVKELKAYCNDMGNCCKCKFFNPYSRSYCSLSSDFPKHWEV